MDAPGSPPRRRGLAHWIAIALAWAVLLAALVLLLLVERFARDHATQTATAALAQIGWQMRDQLDRGMAYRYEELRILSVLREMQPGTPTAQMRAMLERVQQSFPLYAWIGWTQRDGRVEAATGALLEGQDVAKRPWFQGGVQGAFVGDVHPAVLLEKLLPQQQEPWRFVDIAMPIYDAGGALRAVLGAHLSWEWARDLQRGLLAPAESAYQAELFVVDAQAQVLLGPRGTEGKPLDLPAVGPLRTAEGAAMRAWGDGQRYATAIVPTVGHDNYPGLGWVVVVRQAERVAFADYHRLQREMAIGGIAVCLLAALCAPLVARRLTRPLHRLTQAVAARAAGGGAPLPLLDAYREVDLLSRALAGAEERDTLHRAELERVNAGLEQRIEERTAEIRASREQLRTITDNMPALVADVDRDLRYRFANRAYRDWFGVEPAQLVGQTLESLYGEETMRRWQPELARVLQGERVQFERSMVLGGRRQHSSATYLPYRDAEGRVDGFHALVFDITASKELELRLEEEATRDALTGLPNRRHLQRNLPAALARADRLEHHLALLFLDLNGFKAINDTHGHEAGDELLQQVGERLVGAVRITDTVARLAGDEFVVLLEPVSDPAGDPQLVAAKIDAAIGVPFALEAATVQVSVSIGGAVYQPRSGRTAEELLSGADSAMYAAKRAGKSKG
ncbi:diguanylate cyclase domain-containing protein [Pseudorhodoferax sp.]|uniref:diguanylate cyclase domain-containing protein n=1 Tax=Pseudorhodoferax sp. TaxID=1993553 RepID=UPI002DD6A9FC|nr:diguanylate cyclase [Pseudorhodoferax sp.]